MKRIAFTHQRRCNQRLRCLEKKSASIQHVHDSSCSLPISSTTGVKAAISTIGRRYFSSSGESSALFNVNDQTLPSAEIIIEEKLQERITELCDDTAVPFGNFTPEIWKESLQALGNMAHLQSPKGLEYCCMMMDRLVIETDHQRNVTTDSTTISSSTGHALSTETLNSIVRNWSKCWEAKEMESVTPPQMLDMVDEWVLRLDHSLLHPDVKTYGMIIKAAINYHNNQKHARSFAANLFHRMIREAEEDVHPNVSPDTKTYGSMIHFWSSLGDTQQAEVYLNQMVMECAKGTSDVQPTSYICNSILAAYSKNAGNKYKDPSSEIPFRVERMVRRMQQLHESGTLKGIKPKLHSFQLLMMCWEKSQRPEAADKVRELYYEIKNSKDSTVWPDATTLEIVLKTLSKTGDAEKAQEILDEHLEELITNNKGTDASRNNKASIIEPNSSCFFSVGTAWYNSKTERSVYMVEKLIERMHNLSDDGTLKDAQVKTKHYVTLLHSLAKHARTMPDANEKAEKVVKTMEKKNMKLNKSAYDCLIGIQAVTGNDPYRAEELLEQMYDAHLADGGFENTKPDTRSFNNCLRAWSESGDEKAPERSDAILRRMHKLYESDVLQSLPNQISYSLLIRCHAKSGSSNASRRCLELLEELRKQKLDADVITYGIVLHCMARASAAQEADDLLQYVITECKENKKLKPNGRLFNSVINAWSRSGNKNAGERGQALVDQMKELNGSGLLDGPPDIACYSSLIQCWTLPRHPWASEKADEILQHLEEMATAGDQSLAPDMSVYNAVMYAYRLSAHAEKAETLLMKIIDMHANKQLKTKKVKLLEHAFDDALLACTNADNPAPEKAESILQKMISLRESGAFESVKPQPRHLNLVLKSYSDKSKHGIGEDTESVLRRYESMADAASFNVVLLSYAALGNARHAENLIRYMHEVGRQGNERLLPECSTYNAVLRALCNSDDNDRFENSDILLREMYDLHKQGDYPKQIAPDSESYCIIMACYVKANHPGAIEYVEALQGEMLERQKDGETSTLFDNAAFHAVMSAHCQVGDPDKAEIMLDEICHAVLEAAGSENPIGLELQNHSLNMVLGAWVRVNNPERAESILRRLCQYRDSCVPKVKPTIANFLTAVDCWNRSKDPLAGERADNLLQVLEEEIQSRHGGRGAAKKDFYLMTMKNLAQVGDGKRAEAMLRRMQSVLRDEKNYTRVDLFLYREVVHAWSQSQDPDADDRIQSLETEIAERFPSRMLK